MPDTPFKSMSREAPRQARDFYARLSDEQVMQMEECDNCKAMIAPGDWPWCRPDHPEDHNR